jgi:hypothetical protein
MKVKTFTGTHRAAVDKQVNDWLAESNVTVRKTNVALKPLRERGRDAIAGRTTTRRALAVAITGTTSRTIKRQNQIRPLGFSGLADHPATDPSVGAMPALAQRAATF